MFGGQGPQPQPVNWKTPVLMRSARYGLGGEWDGPAEDALCPACRLAMKLHQLDTSQPRKLMGVCASCGEFYPVVDESDRPAPASLPFAGGR